MTRTSALNNIAKHAEANNVGILLERRAGQVSLIVEDDGIGFDGEQAYSQLSRIDSSLSCPLKS
jgi:signal transduction histidine kinase